MISHGAAGGPVHPAVTVTRAVFGPADAGRGDRPAVLDAATGRVLTHAGLAAAVGSAAAGLAREGTEPGTVVGLHLPDGPEFAIALHAVIAAGAVPFPVRATASGGELSRLLAGAGAGALIAGRASPDGGVARVHRAGAEGFPTLSGGGGVAPDVPLDPARAPALLVCTGGVAGPARTVRLTHAEVAAGLVRVADAGMLGGGDVVLSALPFSGTLGLNGVLNPALRLGATVVALPAAGGRHDLLRALQDHRVTVAVLPPWTVEALARDAAASGYRLGGLRAVVSAGGPLDAGAARACGARLGCPVRQAYGLAEAAGLTHLNLRAAEEGTLDSVGRGLPGVAWRVASPRSGAVRPAYQPGELCVRLPVTRAAAVPARWLPTGDAAFADEHGRAFILGRLDGARPDPPAEPVEVLARHPAVRDAAVVPAPDPDLGLAQHAFVVLAAQACTGALLAHVNARVPAYRRLAAVHAVELIPRTPDGRVRRRALLESAGLEP